MRLPVSALVRLTPPGRKPFEYVAYTIICSASLYDKLIFGVYPAPEVRSLMSSQGAVPCQTVVVKHVW